MHLSSIAFSRKDRYWVSLVLTVQDFDLLIFLKARCSNTFVAKYLFPPPTLDISVPSGVHRPTFASKTKQGERSFSLRFKGFDSLGWIKSSMVIWLLPLFLNKYVKEDLWSPNNFNCLGAHIFFAYLLSCRRSVMLSIDSCSLRPSPCSGWSSCYLVVYCIVRLEWVSAPLVYWYFFHRLALSGSAIT